jgi:hypothetical protein
MGGCPVSRTTATQPAVTRTTTTQPAVTRTTATPLAVTLLIALAAALAALIVAATPAWGVPAKRAHSPHRRPSAACVPARGKKVRARPCRRRTASKTKLRHAPKPARHQRGPQTPSGGQTGRPGGASGRTGATSGTPSGPGTASQPAAGGTAAGSSAWDRPALTNPTVITLSDANRNLQLDQTRDYIVQCPPGRFDTSGRITIWGGHNVVFQNCDEYVTLPSGDWAGYLEDQTGTLWVHDVHFGGVHLTGGVQLQEPGATVVLRDVLFDTVYGSYQTNHAECVQTWSGPARLLIDGLQCPTTYQGLFLLPNQWDSTTIETTWDFRNVQIDGQGAYDLWMDGVNGAWGSSSWPAPFILHLENVHDCGTGEPLDYAGAGNRAWANVQGCGSGAVSPPVWSDPTGIVTGLDDAADPVALPGEQR